MSISSMTGFARAQGQNEACSWTWEVRSVNGRGLDMRCRLPGGFDHLDPVLRERVAKRFKRGNMTFSLSIRRVAREGALRVNPDVLDQVIAMIPEIRRRLPDVAPPTVDGLFAVRGVVETQDDETEADEAAQEALDKELLASLDTALDALQQARREEGERLTGLITGQLDQIATLCGEAEGLIDAQPGLIRERLARQVAALLEDLPPLPEERIAQEAALLMVKADPREELDRLKAHLEAGHALLAEKAAIGRRLDFLCQEFNREANTLCSKASDIELGRRGMALKAVIDQMREQVQNIE